MNSGQVEPLAAALASTINALVAGALVVALVVILPLLMAEPDERYPRTNVFVLRRMDKVMPVLAGLALLATVAAVAAAATANAGWITGLHALAAVGLATLLTISLAALRPLNAAIDTRPGGAALGALRDRWRRWHIARVGAAQLAAIANATALIVIIH